MTPLVDQIVDEMRVFLEETGEYPIRVQLSPANWVSIRSQISKSAIYRDGDAHVGIEYSLFGVLFTARSTLHDGVFDLIGASGRERRVQLDDETMWEQFERETREIKCFEERAEARNFNEGAQWAAGWIVALTKMGEAIRHTDRMRRDPLYAALEEHYGTPGAVFLMLRRGFADSR